MNKLEAMRAFSLVAEHQSFTRAAQQLNLSATMVSRYIKQLENDLGCLLLKRSTRKVFLTDAGEQYWQHISPLLQKLTSVDEQMAELGRHPSGKLVISTSIEFGGQYLAPVIHAYRERHPQVELDVLLSNEPVDLFNSKVDLAFRVAPALPDASYIAQEVCYSTLALWASPHYLNQHGTPSCLADLHQHQLLFFNHSIRKDHWIFTHQGVNNERHALKLKWAWSSNNGRLLNEAAAAGQGIIQAPGYSVAQYVKAGQLVEVLPEASIRPLTISAVYPHRYELSTRVKTFVETAKQHFRDQELTR